MRSRHPMSHHPPTLTPTQRAVHRHPIHHVPTGKRRKRHHVGTNRATCLTSGTKTYMRSDLSMAKIDALTTADQKFSAVMAPLWRHDGTPHWVRASSPDPTLDARGSWLLVYDREWGGVRLIWSCAHDVLAGSTPPSTAVEGETHAPMSSWTPSTSSLVSSPLGGGRRGAHPIHEAEHKDADGDVDVDAKEAHGAPLRPPRTPFHLPQCSCGWTEAPAQGGPAHETRQHQQAHPRRGGCRNKKEHGGAAGNSGRSRGPGREHQRARGGREEEEEEKTRIETGNGGVACGEGEGIVVPTMTCC